MIIETIDIRLIAVDLDGTLLTSEKTLAPEGAHLLRKAAHGTRHVVLATTRNPDSVRTFCHALEIDDPIICTNGAQVWGTPNGPVWSYHSIPYKAALEIARLADTHNWELSTTVGEITYCRQQRGQLLEPSGSNVKVIASNSEAMVEEPVRILTWHPDAVNGVRRLCQSKLVNQCYAETYYKPDGTVDSLGVFALPANKGAALDLVLNRLGLKSDQVMAIGDNPNDLPMFTRALVNVAMSNAPIGVKQKATIVAPSNNEEGVAWVLKTYGVV